MRTVENGISFFTLSSSFNYMNITSSLRKKKIILVCSRLNVGICKKKHLLKKINRWEHYKQSNIYVHRTLCNTNKRKSTNCSLFNFPPFTKRPKTKSSANVQSICHWLVSASDRSKRFALYKVKPLNWMMRIKKNHIKGNWWSLFFRFVDMLHLPISISPDSMHNSWYVNRLKICADCSY